MPSRVHPPVRYSNLRILKNSFILLNNNFYYLAFISYLIVAPYTVAKDLIILLVYRNIPYFDLEKISKLKPEELIKRIQAHSNLTLTLTGLFGLFSVVLLYLATVALIGAVGNLVKGEKANIRAVYLEALKRFLPFLGTEALIYLIVVVLVLIISPITIFIPSAVAIIPIPILIILPYIYLSRFITCIEKKGPIASIKKNISLVKGAWLPVSFSVFAFLIIGYFLQSFIVSSTQNLPIPWLVILVELLTNVITIYVTIAFVLLYQELVRPGARSQETGVST